MKSLYGFTLLEMLLALALGAMLMATVSTVVMPLLQSNSTLSKSLNESSDLDNSTELLSNMDRIAKMGIAVFPSALDTGVERTSLAIQLLGTGEDVSADANGDGKAGIANMDPNGYTKSNVSDSEDDDKDGTANEDPINGLDDDNDGLIDEDPNNDSDENSEGGVSHVDDNRDGTFDNQKKVNISNDLSPWHPYLPKSLYSKHLNSNTFAKPSLFFSSYRKSQDDNEDGITNNGPAVTWTARFENGKIVCTTPTTEYQDSSRSNLSYREYDCLENVNDFKVTRNINAKGLAVLTIDLNYSLAGEEVVLKHRLFFP